MEDRDPIIQKQKYDRQLSESILKKEEELKRITKEVNVARRHAELVLENMKNAIRKAEEEYLAYINKIEEDKV